MKKYKFLLIGDPNVGKSCILVRYVDGKFQEGTQNTIGQDNVRWNEGKRRIKKIQIYKKQIHPKKLIKKFI